MPYKKFKYYNYTHTLCDNIILLDCQVKTHQQSKTDRLQFVGYQDELRFNIQKKRKRNERKQ
jgi:hypothetical protein